MAKWLLVLAAMAGCGTDPPNHPIEATAPIIGDWFLCDTADCSTLKNHGVTWAVDGTWVLLEVRDAQGLTPTGTYCASPYDANRGVFTFDEATGALTMMDDLGRDAGGGTLSFALPTVTLTQASNGVTALYTKIDPPRLSGACPLPF